jgi:hypothetical protein
MGIELLDLIKVLWMFITAFFIPLAAWAWNHITERINLSQEKYDILTKELHDVKLQYLEKAEIEKIEARIDKRFDEMRELLLELIKTKVKGE